MAYTVNFQLLIPETVALMEIIPYPSANGHREQTTILIGQLVALESTREPVLMPITRDNKMVGYIMLTHLCILDP